MNRIRKVCSACVLLTIVTAVTACSSGQSSKLSDEGAQAVLNQSFATHELGEYYNVRPKMASLSRNKVTWSWSRANVTGISPILVEGNKGSLTFTVMYIGESSDGQGQVERREGSAGFIRDQDGNWVLTTVSLPGGRGARPNLPVP